MALAFNLVNGPLQRHRDAMNSSALGIRRRRKLSDDIDGDDPEVQDKLRAMFPDFDEFTTMVKSVDYKYECKNDARFATKYRIPDGIDATFVGKKHDKGVDAVQITRKGFLTAGHDDVRLWEMERSTRKRHFSAYDAAVDIDSNSVVLAGQTGYEIADLDSLAPKKAFIHDGTINCCKIQSGKVVAGNQKGVVYVHDCETGKPTYSWMPHSRSITSVNWQDPHVIATSSRAGDVAIFDIRKNPYTTFKYLPSVQSNVTKLKSCFYLNEPNLGYTVHDVKFLGSKELLTAGGDNALRRWDLRYNDWSSSETLRYLGHTAAIRKFELSPNKTLIATCCENGSARLFKVDELQWRRDELKAASSAHRQTLQQKVDQRKRDGFSSAVLSLDGHVGIVSGCAWEDDTNIFTCSWDQTVRKFLLPDKFD